MFCILWLNELTNTCYRPNAISVTIQPCQSTGRNLRHLCQLENTTNYLHLLFYCLLLKKEIAFCLLSSSVEVALASCRHWFCYEICGSREKTEWELANQGLISKTVIKNGCGGGGVLTCPFLLFISNGYDSSWLRLFFLDNWSSEAIVSHYLWQSHCIWHCCAYEDL